MGKLYVQCPAVDILNLTSLVRILNGTVSRNFMKSKCQKTLKKKSSINVITSIRIAASSAVKIFQQKNDNRQFYINTKNSKL